MDYLKDLSISDLLSYKDLVSTYLSFNPIHGIPMEDVYKVRRLVDEEIRVRVRDFVEIVSDDEG